MFKSLISTQLSVLLLTTLSAILPLPSAHGVTFQETEVQQSDFIAVAQPYGDGKYNLIVIEQIQGKNQCWSEAGANPVNVDLLLANFDFSGHCRRSTDSNGYSIRSDGQDYGLDILLDLVEQNGNLILVGNHRRNPGQAPIIIGTAQGLNGQPMKINLNQGWRFSKRTYEGKVLGHVYFSYDSATAQTPLPLNNNEPTQTEATNQEVNTPPATLPEEIPQGTIQEIVSPDIQSQKQIVKPVTINRTTRSNLTQTRWDRR
ncbi:DUF3747 domain-containing protein [Geminocystis sp. CENA526]|uniref:DUF3747 domain-containing protein n=1 Tax=Geminocystis sp. CENA526 TaxID=1355871 RepID=UPI003D6E94CD